MMAATFNVRAGDFNFNVYGGSTNLWSSTFMQIPSNLINNVISVLSEDEGTYGGALRFNIMKVKNDGDKVSLRTGNYFGFKAKDMFSNIQYGLKFGWAPTMSPFGVYVSCAYQFRRFEAELETDTWSKFKLNSIRPGIGIRVTPFLGLLENDKFSPIIEVGTSYNYYFSVNAPYGKSKDQFKSGMVSTLALGARNPQFSFAAGVELDHYNMFNQDFTPDNGVTYPYKNLKSKNFTIFVSLSKEF